MVRKVEPERNLLEEKGVKLVKEEEARETERTVAFSHLNPSAQWSGVEYVTVCVCVITHICKMFLIMSGNPGGFYDSLRGTRGYPGS